MNAITFDLDADGPGGRGLHLRGKAGQKTFVPPGRYAVVPSLDCGARSWFRSKHVDVGPGEIVPVQLTATASLGVVNVVCDGYAGLMSMDLFAGGRRVARVKRPVPCALYVPDLETVRIEGEVSAPTGKVRYAAEVRPADWKFSADAREASAALRLVNK